MHGQRELMPLMASHALIARFEAQLGSFLPHSCPFRGRNVISERWMWLPFLAPTFSWTGLSWPQNGLRQRQLWKLRDSVTVHKVNMFMLTVLGYDLTNIKHNWSLKKKEAMRHSTDLHVTTPMWRPRLVPGKRSSIQQVSELESHYVPNHSITPEERQY